MKNSSSKSKKVKAVSDELGEQIDALRSDVKKLMESASDEVSEGLDQAGHQISKTSRSARKVAANTMTDHPIAAMGIAVGVGVLVGLIASKD